MEVFLLDCPCCGKDTVACGGSGLGRDLGGSGSLGRCYWGLSMAPHSLSFPQQPRCFSLPTKWKIHVAALTATTRIGSGAKPPFLSASKAAFGKQEPPFSPSSSFIQSQFDLIRIFKQGEGICIPLRHLSTGMEVLLHPHKPAAASKIFPQCPFKTIFPSNSLALYLCSGDIYYLVSLFIIHQHNLPPQLPQGHG